MAGVEGFELRNVVANYPFERSDRFAGIQPNSGHRDHSRLSCGGRNTQLEAGSAGIFRKRSARTLAIVRRRRSRAQHALKRKLGDRNWEAVRNGLDHLIRAA